MENQRKLMTKIFFYINQISHVVSINFKLICNYTKWIKKPAIAIIVN